MTQAAAGGGSGRRGATTQPLAASVPPRINVQIKILAA